MYNEGVTGSVNMAIDDDEPIYDRLRDREEGGGGVTKYARLPLSHKRADSQSYRRIRGSPSKPNRESVLNLADDLMERSIGTLSMTYDPTPMEHTVSEVEMASSMQISSSVQPEVKLHMSTPLAPHHRRPNSSEPKIPQEGTKRPMIEVTSPMTSKGTVSMMTKMFSYPQPATTSASAPGMKGSRTPVARQGNTPLKAMTRASEMTKSGAPIKSNVGESKVSFSNDHSGSMVRNSGPYSSQGSSRNKVQLRSSDRKRAGKKARPASFDLSLLLKNKRNLAVQKHDYSSSSNNNTGDSDSDGNLFHRNVDIRKAFRKRSKSRELSPDSAPEDSKVLSESECPSEVFPRSPTTGVLISNSETSFFLSEEIPEFNEMNSLNYSLEEEEKNLSQTTGSHSSQDSIRNLRLTVRERTQRWEARGGGVPSYFSTLPRSFRHKATDRRKDPAYIQYLRETMDQYPEEDYDEEMVEMMMMLSSANATANGGGGGDSNVHQSSRTSTSSFGSQQSGIPLPISKILSSCSSQPGSSQAAPNSGMGHGSGTGVGSNMGRNYHHSSVSPEVHGPYPRQNYHLRMHSADDGVRSLDSSGRSPSSNENSLERRLGDTPLRGESSLRRSSTLTSGWNAGPQVRV